MSEMATFKRTVVSFVEKTGIEATVEARLLDPVSDVGKLSKEALKATDYERAPFYPSGSWAGEMGDIFFSLICLANSTGVDLEAALNGALGKYRERLALGGDAGSGC